MPIFLVCGQALQEVNTCKICFLLELKGALALAYHDLSLLEVSDWDKVRRCNGSGSDSGCVGLMLAFSSPNTGRQGPSGS